MRTWELFKQALAGAARARLRSALTALGVAIGCGALVSMIAFALGLQRELEAPFKQFGMLNDIQVSQRDRRRDERREQGEDASEAGENNGEDIGNGDGSESAATSPPNGPEPKARAPLDAAAVDRIRRLPGVRYAYPDLTLQSVAVARERQTTTCFAMALPREIGVVDKYGEMLIAGRFFSLGDSAEVLVTESLLDEIGIDAPAAAIDQQITVSNEGVTQAGETGLFALRQRSLSVRIAGVIRPPDFGLGRMSLGEAVILPVDLIVQLPGLVESQLRRVEREGASALDSYATVTVRAEDPAKVPGVVRAIEDLGFETRTRLDQLEDMRIAFLFIESVLTAVGSVALVIAGLGIANTLLMTVLERYEEIGLYKAIGATDGDVRLMFLAEATVLGLVGSLGGLVLAAVVCWGLQWGVNWHLANEDVKRTVDVFYFPWWLLLSAVGIATLLSVICGLYPASRAARVDPIKALRRT
jgi:putative ABC transport system permease protein